MMEDDACGNEQLMYFLGGGLETPQKKVTWAPGPGSVCVVASPTDSTKTPESQSSGSQPTSQHEALKPGSLNFRRRASTMDSLVAASEPSPKPPPLYKSSSTTSDFGNQATESPLQAKDLSGMLGKVNKAKAEVAKEGKKKAHVTQASMVLELQGASCVGG